MKATINWNHNLEFDSETEQGYQIIMDAPEESGGGAKGPKPKELLLHALGGCTGMDVISLLKKMRAMPESFKIEIDADQTEEHPRIFRKISIQYIFSGSQLDKEKIEKAVTMSQEKYCGVSEILRRSASLEYIIQYNNE